jgi:hypothetical protein
VRVRVKVRVRQRGQRVRMQRQRLRQCRSEGIVGYCVGESDFMKSRF